MSAFVRARRTVIVGPLLSSLTMPVAVYAPRSSARRLVARADDQECIFGHNVPRSAIIGASVGAAALIIILVLVCCYCTRRDDTNDAWHAHWLDSVRRRRKSNADEDDDGVEKPAHRISDSDPYPEVPNYSGAYAPMIGAQQAAFSAVMAAAATGSQPGQPAAAAASYKSASQPATSQTRPDAMYPRQPQSVDPSQSGFTGAPASRSRPGVSFANGSQSGYSGWRGAGSKFTARTGQSRGQGTIAPTVVDSNAGSSWHGGSSTLPGSRAPGLAYRPAAPRSDGGSSFKGSAIPSSDIQFGSAYGQSRAGTSAAH